MQYRIISLFFDRIGIIFEKYKIEKFFTWTVDEIGKLDWELKKDFIEAEKKLDGCYVIKSNATCKSLNKQEVIVHIQLIKI